MSEQGATASYRGYRLQALYILLRVLEPRQNGNLIFVPEGIEDLAIWESEILQEIVQVKSYDGLTLAHLEPAKQGSFFHRACTYIQRSAIPKIRIVNIGPIGPELQDAWAGKEKSRASITIKMVQHGFSSEQIQQLFDHVELVSVEEKQLSNQTLNQLQELLTGVDPTSAFDLLHKWLFDLSEIRAPISNNDLIEKVNSVGGFLAERAHHHKEWFTNIIPIEGQTLEGDHEKTLQDEFYAGASARFEHILANLDFLRPNQIQAIANGFNVSNVCIVHGASGQGKSTLAFRFLHDHYSEYCRYKVQIVEDRQHALSTATALSGHANALHIPMIVYLDVSPRDHDWFELVAQLAKHPYIHVLVTIREEDFRRTNIPSHIDFIEIELEFNEEEARKIFERAQSSGLDLAYLSFEEAWDAFGGEGPLLEFVYSLTQTITLRQRLEEQAQRLQIMVSKKEMTPDEVLLLRLVSVISAYGGRLHIPSLINSLDIPEPALTLHYYEKEYLIRISPDRLFIEALHPIRSQLLADILVDPAVNPWIDLATTGIPHTPEEDWETFLLHALIKRPAEEEGVLALAKSLLPTRWVGLAGLLRCFLWIGAKTYLETNDHILEEARELLGPAWFFIPDLNFAGEEGPNIEGWWNSLGNLIPEETKGKIEAIRRKQTPKREVLQFSKTWLRGQDSQPVLPESSQDWGALAEVLYWTSRTGCSEKTAGWITDDALVSALKNLTISEFSEVAFALYKCTPDRYSKWVEAHFVEIKIRLAEEYRIIVLEDRDDARIAHFLSYPEERSITEGSKPEEVRSIHDETMERIQVVRQLFPGFAKYGAQGYGHQAPGLEDIPDDSEKSGVPRHLLPPKWPVRINGLATGLLRNQLRPESWEEYIQSILGVRKLVVDNLVLLSRHVEKYFQREKPENFLDAPPFSTGDWDHLQTKIGDLPLLSRAAVDPWGFGQPEGSKSDLLQSPNLLPSSILQQKYKPYLDAEREYYSRLHGFLPQAMHVSVINIRAGKLPESSTQRQTILSELESKGVMLNSRFLSSINLWEALLALPNYQKRFESLFSQRVNAQMLANLEERELKIIEYLLLCWIFFANYPKTALGNVKSQIPRRSEQQYQSLLREIGNALDAMTDESAKAQVIETDRRWDDEPALWIQIDFPSPLYINEKVEEVILKLREAIGTPQYGDPDYFLIEMKCKHVIIVPTVQNKLIENKVWPLRTSLTLTQDHDIEDKPYLYVPQEISSGTFEEIGLELWKIENLEIITEFEISFSELMARTALLGKMAELPEFPDELLPSVELYLQDRSAEVSDALQRFVDSATVFIERVNNLPNEEIAKREQLHEAVQVLIHIKESVLPEDGVLKIPLSEMQAFSQVLQEAIAGIQFIKLIWLNDILSFG